MNKIADIYGEVTIQEGALWGANTQRSLENFPIGTEKMPKEFIEMLCELKRACAVANQELKAVEYDKTLAIIKAIDELLMQDFMQHFPLAIWQTGSGTQTNMNANEVIATLASRILGSKVHPNDDVNHGQSSNDVYPTAMHMMAVNMIAQDLIPVLDKVIITLTQLKRENTLSYKLGRTHFQDATPMTFAQEVSGWIVIFTDAKKQLEALLPFMRQLSIGGTAVGTGLNTIKGFDEQVVRALSQSLKQEFTVCENKFFAMGFKDAYVSVHGILNTLASNCLKLTNDIRFLSSGPQTGLQEIKLPANEAGSSIMPGKVNPKQAESLAMVCVRVIGNHQTITLANSHGNLQLNTYMPVMVYSMWQSIRLLSDGLDSFNTRCLAGIEVNTEKMMDNVTSSIMTATFLNEKLGYDTTAKIVKEAYQDKKTLKEVVVSNGHMTAEEFDQYFDYSKMIQAK